MLANKTFEEKRARLRTDQSCVHERGCPKHLAEFLHRKVAGYNPADDRGEVKLLLFHIKASNYNFFHNLEDDKQAD